MALGRSDAVLVVLAARGVVVPEASRDAILGCADLDQLATWLRRALTASTIEDVFAS
jgi:hypothetical protein